MGWGALSRPRPGRVVAADMISSTPPLVHDHPPAPSAARLPTQFAAHFVGPGPSEGGRVAPGLVGVRGLGRAREPRDGKAATSVKFLRRFRPAAARRRRLGVRRLPWCLRAGRGSSTGDAASRRGRRRRLSSVAPLPRWLFWPPKWRRRPHSQRPPESALLSSEGRAR